MLFIIASFQRLPIQLAKIKKNPDAKKGRQRKETAEEQAPRPGCYTHSKEAPR